MTATFGASPVTQDIPENNLFSIGVTVSVCSVVVVNLGTTQLAFLPLACLFMFTTYKVTKVLIKIIKIGAMCLRACLFKQRYAVYKC